MTLNPRASPGHLLPAINVTTGHARAGGVKHQMKPMWAISRSRTNAHQGRERVDDEDFPFRAGPAALHGTDRLFPRGHWPEAACVIGTRWAVVRPGRNASI